MKPRARRPWWQTYPTRYWTPQERELAIRDGWSPSPFKWPARVETNLPGAYEAPPVESPERARARRVDAIVKKLGIGQ